MTTTEDEMRAYEFAAWWKEHVTIAPWLGTRECRAVALSAWHEARRLHPVQVTEEMVKKALAAFYGVAFDDCDFRHMNSMRDALQAALTVKETEG